ncbi:DinB family protein [Mucilaginibacter polytrichastri]|uniref:DinB-like domain-containing protein n=1 Tax=Mucilaginibacter polytrichastri TaxID=1302689 RepID=A0A1Q5ZY03_9SPHI|nr:DinB family protein [Mucilaginibacter polytrichastri]OKS86631.1 hypothetical protein RG47T_2087 [Mucilaginibacter polytrichastri]SFS81269.1 DinB superfamily protein [Mucilaginibacter polytrichastri]
MNTLLAQLETTIDDFIIYTKSAGINWANKSSPEKWSNQEIIGHLIDSAQINLQRFIRCTFEENFKLIYFQNEWVIAQCYQDADPNELLALWRLLNRQMIRVLANYPPQLLDVKCDNGKDEPSLHTVNWLAHDYLSHLQHHLKQIG